ncbi:unnamed protein product [Dibothriocephalus latus]|uniref:Uncharacterized protein n=1 Tax=Dibothriocephalus latus TaxID=60516 RepID=A0A3P6S8G9_DIBLA|nr:unnamed protein product [Dibothriocephalus latus]
MDDQSLGWNQLKDFQAQWNGGYMRIHYSETEGDSDKANTSSTPINNTRERDIGDHIQSAGQDSPRLCDTNLVSYDQLF